MYVCTCVCMYLCMYVFTYVCMYVHTYVCMYVCTYVCMFVHTYICIYVCTYVCMYICIYICMYVCMYICIESAISKLQEATTMSCNKSFKTRETTKKTTKQKISSMVDKGTYYQKEKTECLKKTIPENEK